MYPATASLMSFRSLSRSRGIVFSPARLNGLADLQLVCVQVSSWCALTRTQSIQAAAAFFFLGIAFVLLVYVCAEHPRLHARVFVTMPSVRYSSTAIIVQPAFFWKSYHPSGRLL